MKAMEALVLLGLIGLVAVFLIYRFAIQPAASAIKRRSQADDPWKVIEDNHDGFTFVYLCKTGHPKQTIGEVSLTLKAWEYQEELETIRIEADDKAATLNRRLGA